MYPTQSLHRQMPITHTMFAEEIMDAELFYTTTYFTDTY